MADTWIKVSEGDNILVDHKASSAANVGLYVEDTKVVGAQYATPIALYTITWSANEPTAGSAATIADGDTPTVAESGQAIADLTAKVNALITALAGHGLITTS